MKHHLCYAELQEERDGPWIKGLAFLSGVGESNIIEFVPADGAGKMRDLKCWDYKLRPFDFAVTIDFDSF